MWGGVSQWLWLALPSWLVMLSIFSCPYWPSVCRLAKCLFKSIAHFWIGVFGGGCWVSGVIYVSWILMLIWSWLINISSHSVGCFFILLIVPFDAKKFSVLIKSNLFFWNLFFFCCQCCCVISKKPLPDPMSWRFSPLLSSKSFIV